MSVPQSHDRTPVCAGGVGLFLHGPGLLPVRGGAYQNGTGKAAPTFPLPPSTRVREVTVTGPLLRAALWRPGSTRAAPPPGLGWGSLGCPKGEPWTFTSPTFPTPWSTTCSSATSPRSVQSGWILVLVMEPPMNLFTSPLVLLIPRRCHGIGKRCGSRWSGRGPSLPAAPAGTPSPPTTGSPSCCPPEPGPRPVATAGLAERPPVVERCCRCRFVVPSHPVCLERGVTYTLHFEFTRYQDANSVLNGAANAVLLVDSVRLPWSKTTQAIQRGPSLFLRTPHPPLLSLHLFRFP